MSIVSENINWILMKMLMFILSLSTSNYLRHFTVLLSHPPDCFGDLYLNNDTVVAKGSVVDGDLMVPLPSWARLGKPVMTCLVPQYCSESPQGAGSPVGPAIDAFPALPAATLCVSVASATSAQGVRVKVIQNPELDLGQWERRRLSTRKTRKGRGGNVQVSLLLALYNIVHSFPASEICCRGGTRSVIEMCTKTYL